MHYNDFKSCLQSNGFRCNTWKVVLLKNSISKKASNRFIKVENYINVVREKGLFREKTVNRSYL